ncbi:MAG: GNAT family N-acetyltransferase [Candidatus Aminicenantes bacterium]|nr:MAG: GNAT family N-acetyltransferase [Candidatus Aminicenantes bacterium]
MAIKIFSELTNGMFKRLEIFGWENFYTKEQRTPEHLAKEQEKFYSKPKTWILAFEKEQIIGRILLHKRIIRFNERDIILGGIGGVCIRRDKRNQGIATKMLELAMKILTKWDCDIAYLCADIEKTGALYEKVGFVPLNRPYTFYGQSRRLHEQNNGMIAPINSRKIFNRVLRSRKKLHLGNGNW